MQCQAKVLLAGVDTLILNAKQVDEKGNPKERQTLPDHVEEHLDTWQELTKENDHPHVTPWTHDEQALHMWPTGAPGWRWLLKNGLIDLMLGPYLNAGAVARVRFSSEYLWRYGGVERALTQVDIFLADLFGETLSLQPSELHLCADMMGFELPNDYERYLVSRARVDRPVRESHIDKPIYRYHQLETVQLSGHGSPLSATIYNKPKEIQVHAPEKVWFHDLWRAQGWTEDQVVWRIECRMKRECLHEMDIEEVSAMIEQIPALWAYCVGHVGARDGWLRMVTPNEQDTNRWRWETQPQWQAVQAAFSCGWRGYSNMRDIQRERKRAIHLDRAEAAIAGYATTYAAWLQDEIGPDDDVSVLFGRLYEKVTERWERKGIDFHKLRRKKQFDYHIS